MFELNSVKIIGTVCKDAELKTFKSNNGGSFSLVEFQLLQTSTWKDRTNGEMKSKDQIILVKYTDKRYYDYVVNSIKIGLKLLLEGQMNGNASNYNGKETVYCHLGINATGKITKYTDPRPPAQVPPVIQAMAAKESIEESSDVPF